MDQRVEKGVGSHVNTPTFTGNGGDPSGNIVSSLPVGHRAGDRYGVQVGTSWGGDSSRRVWHEQQWNAEGSVASPHGERSGEYEEGDEGDSGEGDGEIDGLVPINNSMAKNRNNSSGSVQSSSEKTCHEKLNSHEHHFFLGLMRGEMLRDKSNNGRGSMSDQLYRSFRADQYDSPVNIAELGMCYALPQREDLSALVQKDSGRDNDCMISGRKQFSATNDYGESLRLYLSDPVTGALMDDAMILSCGHSYGNAGIQHVIQMKACIKCGFPASSDTMRPNLALRAAVKAFHREEESESSKSTKRRKGRFEQERFHRDDLLQMDTSKGKGVQFPFCVSDRVMIKGNKRTPQRFVGRVAVVTTQCLNGWYVVKTLDNAESVKLQYRSLQKFSGAVVPFQHNTAS